MGYADANFCGALANVQDITYRLITALLVGAIDPWVPEIVGDNYDSSLVSNCKNIPDGSHFPFYEYVGPVGTLKCFVDFNVAHCRDNSMVYLELKDDSASIKQKDPAGFQTGDTIEFGFAVVAFKRIQAGILGGSWPYFNSSSTSGLDVGSTQALNRRGGGVVWDISLGAHLSHPQRSRAPAWSHPNPLRTDRAMGNSLKMSQSGNFSTAPSNTKPTMVSLSRPPSKEVFCGNDMGNERQMRYFRNRQTCAL
ncbi:hypothetical protein C8R44DRAFT_746440 [Mycena epipterygia]|nr:hypothetical protein C8R44DRAFT_746440 [Mycena epipterygia]